MGCCRVAAPLGHPACGGAVPARGQGWDPEQGLREKNAAAASPPRRHGAQRARAELETAQPALGNLGKLRGVSGAWRGPRSSGGGQRSLQLEEPGAIRATEAKAIQCLVFLVFNL